MRPLSPGSAVAKFDASCAESNINYTLRLCVRFTQSSLGRSSRSHVSRTVCAHHLENVRPSEPHQLCFCTPPFYATAALPAPAALLLSFRTAASLLLLPVVPSPSVRRPLVSHTNSGGCRSTLVWHILPAEELSVPLVTNRPGRQ